MVYVVRAARRAGAGAPSRAEARTLPLYLAYISIISPPEQVRARRLELEHAKLVRHVALIERHAAMPMGAQMGTRSAAADS